MKKNLVLFLIIFLLTSCFNKELTQEEKDNLNNEKEFSSRVDIDNKKMLSYWVSFYKSDINHLAWFSWDLSICNSNNLIICDLISKGFFYNTYSNVCLSYNDISKCDLLDLNDQKYCKWNFYLQKLINTKNKSICDNFREDFSYWELMWSKKYNNKDACNKIYNDLLSKDNLTEKDITKFSDDLDGWEALFNRLKWILLEGNASNVDNFTDYLKIMIPLWKIDCSLLKDKNYIFWLLKWKKSIFNDKSELKQVINDKK